MSSPKLSPTTAAGTAREDRDYWLKKLAPERAAAVLPARGADRPAAAAAARETIALELPPDVAEGLRRLSGGSSFLLYAALMAGVKACLYRYAGGAAAGAVSVGSPARRKTDGSFQKANAVAVVDEVSPRASFRQLLQGVRATLLEAYAHQDYAYSRVLRDLGLDDAAGACPLFEVALSLADIHDRLPDVRNGLTINLSADGESIRGAALYNPQALAPDTVARFFKHCGQLLRHGLKHPDASLSGLPLIDEDERRELLEEFGRGPVEDAPRQTASELFERHAAERPRAAALCFGEETLTYAELNSRANRLAHRLRRLGAGPETLVGIYARRGAELVVGVLAVWKAGAAYLPLDPDYPRERIGLMLEDARASLLLTHGDLAAALPPHGARVVRLDADAEVVARESDENPTPAADALTPAYVIYTSGSTGRPKGVVVTHGGLFNLTLALRRVYNTGPGERVLQFASPSFDASVAELSLALCTGASLILAPREELLPGPGLISLFRRHAITNVTLPPSALSAMPSDELPDLRTLVVAGEACPAEAVERWAPGRRFVNAYGPTEATVWATFKDCSAGEGQPTIGRPVTNAEVFILDASMRPVPVGVSGEMYLGGAGIARGYLNRPELTAERFVPHPFSDEPGARLYKTGDVARFREDGEIEFLGRSDEQVKVRGFRIELGEVESALREQEGVRDCVVIAREDASGDKRLVAYVTPDGERGVAASELRATLRGRLPEYMVPSAFVVMDELPLTPNGKVDRKALPAPDAARPESGEAHASAGNPVEEVLAGIWADVLGVEQVGLHDNFLELGGHSLLATRVFSRVREAFQVEVPIKTLFEAPTVAGLARVISAAMGAASAAHAERPITRRPAGEALPLSSGQQRLWFLHQLEPDSPLYNIPAAVRLRGRLDARAMEASLAEVVRRHEVLRTTFKAVDGRPVAVVTSQTLGALRFVDLTRVADDAREAEAMRLATAEARAPFDLERGPIVRGLLVRLAEDDHVLLVTMHHIASDGWSLGVLIGEVVALYTAYAAGQASPLPELEVQYADYVRWQREWLAGDVLDAQLSYWKRQLEGAERVLRLPTAHARPEAQGHRGQTKSLRLSKPLTEALRALSRREGATLFMTLLAALQTLLYRYTGQSDITVGSPVAGRTRRETEPLIGFFINVLAMRTDLSGNPGFRELLGRVRRTALGAYANQDVPFERLIGELQLERTLSHAPLFQVVFVLQNMPMPELELPGLAMSYLFADRGTTQSDLYLSMTDTEEGLVGGLKYNTDLFDEATADRLLEHFETLLAGVVSDPDARLLDLRLQTEAETRNAAPPPATQAALRADQFTF